jgi:hypothetical protein
MDWIHMTQGRNKWRAVVYSAMKIRFPLNAGIFLQDKKSFVSGIIIDIIILISFMYGIYNHIPETNHVYGVYSVATVLY